MNFNTYQPYINENTIRSKKFKKRIEIITSRLKENKKILDIGCNSGYNSLFLSNIGHEVTGIDMFPEQKKFGGYIDDMEKFSYQNKDVTIIKDDMFNYIKKCQKFDYILCLLVLHHYLDPPKIISFEKTDLGFTNKIICFLDSVINKCEICYLQFRIDNSQSYELHVKLFLLSIGFKEVNILKNTGYAHPNPIFECIS